MRNFASWMAVLLVLGVGCDGETPPPDGGGGVDASIPDGGPAPDSGPADGGSPMDGGPADAGLLADAGRDGGSILPPVDAGNPFGDAGALGAPEWAPIDVRTDGTACAPLLACGGDVEGTWDVTGGCIDVPVPAALMMCPGATVMASGRARGRVTFDAVTADTGVATRLAQYEVTADIFVPGLCAAFAGGCSAIEAQIQMAAPDARCVTTMGSDCQCAIRTIQVIDDMDGYRTEDGQIISTTSGRTWNYCVDAGSMRYQQVGDDEPGIIELGLR